MKKDNLRILITNDDGIEADGIHALRRVAESISEDIWLSAPISEQSCKSQSITVNHPVRIKHYEPKVHAITGTPADCVFLALSEIMADNLPDLVLSGVNHGSNYGQDVFYSGTAAGAREATLRGVPAISLSYRYITGQPSDWSGVLTYGPDIIKTILKLGIPKGTFINVNFPHCGAEAIKGIKVVKGGKKNSLSRVLKRQDHQSNDYFWFVGTAPSDDTEPECDVSYIHNFYITITPVTTDYTNYEVLEAYKEKFKLQGPR